MADTFALVYQRPDGWWSAGHGWTSIDAARAAGNDHNWAGARWAIVNTDALIDIDGDIRLPADVEPTDIENGAPDA